MDPSTKLHRRKFLASLGLLSVALPNTVLSSKSSIEQNPAIFQRSDFAIAPYLESLSSSSCCISILTTNRSFTWIEYGENNLDQTAYQYSHGFRQAEATLFKIKIEGLKPDTTYRYRVVSKPILDFQAYRMQFGDEIHSETYSFKTAAEDADECRAIIYNDIHDRPESFAALWKHKSANRTDLVVFNGDIFNYQTDEQQLVDHFFKPINTLFSSETPFVLVRGNHETRGKFAREFISYFDLPHGKTYQSFRQGPIYWIFLDAGEDKEDTHNAYSGMTDFDKLRVEQRDWLLDIVQKSEFKKAPFKIVVMHIPPIHSGDWHGPKHCKELFLPIFNTHKIDLVLSGHTHKHALHAPSGDHKFALLIGGGPKDGNRTIAELHATKKQLQVSMKNENGEELYRWAKDS